MRLTCKKEISLIGKNCQNLQKMAKSTLLNEMLLFSKSVLPIDVSSFELTSKEGTMNAEK